MKKGIFFTIIIVMLVSVLLSLSILNYKNYERNKDRLSEIGSLDRLTTITTSISNGFKELFETYSGMNVISYGNNIIFEETLVNSQSSNFKSKLDSYESYLESQDSSILIDLTEFKSVLPLTIMPHNITYKHNSYGGSQIIVIPSQLNFNKYHLDITPGFNITSCTWNYTTGSLSFELETGNAGCDDLVSLDYTVNNVININNGGMLINVNDSLYITNNLANSDIKVNITLNKMSNDNPIVVSQVDVMHINYPLLNISRNSGFRII